MSKSNRMKSESPNVVLICAVVLQLMSAATAAARPNIIFILADDLVSSKLFQ